MAFNVNYPISDNDVTESLQSISKLSANMKTQIFRTSLDRSYVSSGDIQRYLGAINVFLKQYDDYAEEIQHSMKHNSIDKNDKIAAVKYKDVKPFIYANYDYASVLPFIDGIIKGVSSAKFKSREDIKDFFEHTVNKAFKDCGDDIGELMEDIIISMDGPKPEWMDAAEISLYNSITSYKWYDDKDRKVIYKAIEKSIEFMCKDYTLDNIMELRDENGNINATMRIHAINAIFDYITYTLSVYALRIYIISQYVGPVIMYKINNGITPMKEATDIGGTSMADMPITAFHEIDEVILQNIYDFTKLMSACGKALETCGADSTGFEGNIRGDGNNIYQIQNAAKKSNKLCSALLNNTLHDSLIKWNFNCDISDGDASKIAEVNQILKSSIHNSLQSISTSFTPKQELINVYSNLKPEHETLEEYREVLTDLIRCGIIIMQRLFMLYKESSEMYNNKHSRFNDRPFSITTTQELYNINKMSKDLYIELGQIVLAKARDFESNINNLRNANTNAILTDLSINVPGLDTKKKSAEFADVTSAAPDTVRGSFMSVVTESYYTELTMQDMYVAEIYGLQDDPYFSEGVGDSFNKFDSIWQRLITAIQKFFNNEKFKLARKWVVEHKDALMNATYNGKLKGIIPYNSKIILDPYLSNIQDQLKKLPNEITREKLMKQSYVDEVTKALYKDDNAYKLFHASDTDANTKKKAYSNFILFNTGNEVVGKVADKEPIEIDASEAGFKDKYLSLWINTIANSETAYNAFNTALDDCRNSIKTLKQKIVQVTGEPANTTTTTTTSENNTEKKPAETGDNKEIPAPPSAAEPKGESVLLEADDKPATASAEPASTSEGNKDSNDKKEESGSVSNNATMLINNLNKACNDLVLNLYTPLTKAITDQYKYIKLAYSIRSGQ